jgi:hypothetical protein
MVVSENQGRVTMIALLGMAAFSAWGAAQASASNADVRKQNRKAQEALSENQRRLQEAEGDRRRSLYGQQVRQLGEIQNVAGTSKGMERVIRNQMARGARDRDALADQFDDRRENIQIQKENVARQMSSQLQNVHVAAIQGGMQGFSYGSMVQGGIKALLEAREDQEAIPEIGDDATEGEQMEFLAKLDAMKAGISPSGLNENTVAPFLKQRENQMSLFDSEQRINAMKIEALELAKGWQTWLFNTAKGLFNGGDE